MASISAKATWSGSNASAWNNADTGGAWTVTTVGSPTYSEGGTGHVALAAAFNTQIFQKLNSATTLTDCFAIGQVKVGSYNSGDNTYPGIYARANPLTGASLTSAYELNLRSIKSEGNVYCGIWNENNGAYVNGLAEFISGTAAASGDKWWLVLMVSGTGTTVTLKGRRWKHGSMPSTTWDATTTDTSAGRVTAAGTFATGLFKAAATTAETVDFDNAGYTNTAAPADATWNAPTSVTQTSIAITWNDAGDPSCKEMRIYYAQKDAGNATTADTLYTGSGDGLTSGATSGGRVAPNWYGGTISGVTLGGLSAGKRYSILIVSENWDGTVSSGAVTAVTTQVSNPTHTANLTFTGAFHKRAAKPPTGNLSFTGNLVAKKNQLKTHTGNLTFSGTLLAGHKFTKTNTGNLTFTGALTTVKLTPQPPQTKTANLTFSGSLAAAKTVIGISNFVQQRAKDLAAQVMINSQFGYTILRRPGKDQTAPTSVGDTNYELATSLDGVSTSAAYSGVIVPLLSNDRWWTLAAYAARPFYDDFEGTLAAWSTAGTAPILQSIVVKNGTKALSSNGAATSYVFATSAGLPSNQVTAAYWLRYSVTTGNSGVYCAFGDIGKSGGTVDGIYVNTGTKQIFWTKGGLADVGSGILLDKDTWYRVRHTVNIANKLSTVSVDMPNGTTQTASTDITGNVPAANDFVDVGMVSTNGTGATLPTVYIDDYVITGWPLTYSGTPKMLNVIGAPAPLLAPRGHDFLALEITTDLQGFPIFETSAQDTWIEGSPDFRYDAYVDGTVGYKMYDINEDVANVNLGAPLPASGWPTLSRGKRIRFDIPVSNRLNGAGLRQRRFRAYSKVLA